MIRVLVGARPGLAQAGMERLIRSIASLEFAGAVDVPDVGLGDLHGDVLLMDGREPVEAEIGDFPIPVVLLSGSGEAGVVSAALRAGVRGVISWDATSEEIEGAIYAVNAGLAVIPAGWMVELLPEEGAGVEEPGEALLDPLSERELEVMDLLTEGLSNKLIAHRLNISEHTVKTHVASILAKLGASSRTEAVSQAIRRGLVML
jgi:two-component system, NarL family, response regulator YdfI